ncbi:hypothetical protein [Nonomuraea recticatena]|uniref:hypothetical protein n=1 Tax=Nonomuraea recticatena TaxID=46178 RepID=UPI0031F970A0
MRTGPQRAPHVRRSLGLRTTRLARRRPSGIGRDAPTSASSAPARYPATPRK